MPSSPGVDRYVEAWERCDVDGFTSLLVDDATFAMPPLATWYRGRETIATWPREFPLDGTWRWRTRLTRANGQPALAFYSRDTDTGPYLPSPDPDAYVNFPREPMDSRRLSGAFGRFGLPEQVTG